MRDDEMSLSVYDNVTNLLAATGGVSPTIESYVEPAIV